MEEKPDMYNKNKDRISIPEKFHGFYRGRVVDVDDPYQKGRVKVEVFGVFDGLSPDALPWAIFADPLMGGQGDLGGFITPDLESHVWVFFEEGDHTQPVYFAGAPARPHGPSEATNGEYPRNKVFRTKAGHYFEVDDSPDATRIKLYHTSGTETEIDHDGNVDQYVVGNVTQVIEGNVDQTVKGNVDRLIEGYLSEEIKGDYTRKVSGNASDSVGGNYTRDTSGNVTETADGNMALTASRIDINE